ncbi:MAG: hypothetical protein AAFX03_03980 [Pseudomonadota bacterium]
MKRFAALAAAALGACATTAPAPDLDDPAAVRAYLEAGGGGVGVADFHFHPGNFGPDALARPTNFGALTIPREGTDVRRD